METMKRLGYIVVAGLLCAFSSCQKGTVEGVGNGGPRTVGFCTGDAVTRTVMNYDGLSSSWENGDRLAVWARNSAGEYTLNNTPFSVYGANGARAFFTATIDSPMPEDRYTYFAAYPVPESVNGTNATFTIPSVQDGRVGSGADIMIAAPVLHGPLEEVKELSDYTRLGMSMEHILHQFRFYVPAGEDKLGGEKIEKIVLDFPKSVVGKIAADFSDPYATPELSDGESSIILKLSEPIETSSSENRNYAMASIFPVSFDAADSFNIKVYSTTKIGTTEPVNLGGRTFAAGHSTPVRLLLSDVRDYARVRFSVSANNLGENADAVRLAAPDGCVWGDGSAVYEYRPGHEITTGESFEIVFEDTDAYRAFSGKDITVTFDTEHVDASQTIRMPDMTSSLVADISAELPYLLYEDFSSVESFNSGDKYSTSNAGNKSPKSFLDGWTGGRVGAESGKCIRIAARRETSADYDARVDSAPITSLKKSADISVSYDYGINNQYGGFAILGADGNVGQDVYVGYVTDTKGYDSGDDAGVFETENTFYAKEYTGSYTNTPNSDTRIIHSAPTGTMRITWRSSAEHQAGTTNTTCWLYIDNVKVQIAK